MKDFDINTGPEHHNPLANAKPDELVRQLLTLVGLDDAIKLLRSEQSARDYVNVAQND